MQESTYVQQECQLMQIDHTICSQAIALVAVW